MNENPRLSILTKQWVYLILIVRTSEWENIAWEKKNLPNYVYIYN